MGGTNDTSSNDISIRQQIVRDRINSKKDEIWSSIEELNKSIISSLTENEKKYLNDKNLYKYYSIQLQDTWNQIKKRREKEILDKLNNVPNYDSIYSKEDLESKLNNYLSSEEIPFLKQENIQNYINKIITDNKIHLKERKKDFRNRIEKRIDDFYFSKRELISSQEDFKRKFENDLTTEEREFLKESDIKNEYERILNSFWTILDNKNREILNKKKDEFKNKIKQKLNEFYQINGKSFNSKEEFQTNFENILTNEEREFSKDSDIGIIYNLYWEKLEQMKEEELRKRKEEFGKTIEKRIDDFYLDKKELINSKEDFKKKFENHLSTEEKKFLEDQCIVFDYNKFVNLLWSKLSKMKDEKLTEKKNEFREEIEQKIGEFYGFKKKLFNSLEEFRINFENYLTTEQREFLKDNDINIIYKRNLNTFWKDLDNKNKEILNKKKDEFKNKIEQKLYDFYLIKGKSFNSKNKEEFKTNFESFLTIEEREFLKDSNISAIYYRNFNSFWEDLEKNEIELIKKNFNDKIQNKIESIYNSNSYTSKENFEKIIINSLSDKEKKLLIEHSDTFDKELYNNFENILNEFWKNKEENKKKKLKDKITENIYTIYQLYGKYIETKEKFNAKIESHLDLNEEELRIMNTNEEIKKYKEDKVNYYWEEMLQIKKEKAQIEEKYKNEIKEYNKYIKELNDKNKEIIDNQKNQIANLLEELKKNKVQEQENIKKIMEEQSKRENKLQEDFLKQMENLENKIKKESEERVKKQLEEEKKKLKEIEDKKSKLRNEFEKKSKDFIIEKINYIGEELQKIENTFCYDEINNYLKSNIKNLVTDILKFNRIGKFIEKNLIFYFETLKDNNIPNIEHLNIILVGPSGAGKSTLINEILKMDPPLETGFGRPITMKSEECVSNNVKYLRLIDSRGIEKDQKYGLDTVFKDVEDIIRQKIKENNPDKYIHCIWYCWQGTRLEESEINVLKELNKIYYEKLPIIIVYTNATDKDKIDNAKKYIQDMHINNFEFIPVIAKETKLQNNSIIKPFNLDELQEKSIKQTKSAINSSCFQGIIEDIKNKIKSRINELVNKVKVNINQEIKKIKEKMNEESDIESLYKDCVSIISNIFYKFVLLNENIKSKDNDNPKIEIEGIGDFSMSEEGHNKIEIYITHYFKKILEIYEINLKDFIQRFSDDISKKIIEDQINFNRKNDNLLTIKMTIEEFKIIVEKNIQKKISKKGKLIALRISFESLIIQFIEKFGYNYSIIYDEAMKKEEYKDFQKMIKSYVSNSFNKLEKIIEQDKLEKINRQNNQNKEDAPTAEEVERRELNSVLDFV